MRNWVSLGRSCALLLLVAAFSCLQSIHAQQVFGNIVGTVTDPSGAPISNAKVTITDLGKGTSSEVSTDESGNFTKGQLIPGNYTVAVEVSGFQKAVSNQITVSVDQTSRFDVGMKVGDVNQQIEVTAAAPLLQTDKADVAQTLTAQQISTIPTTTRNLQSLELLNPGTAQLGWSHAADENPQGSVQMIVNGQMFDSMGYYLDGTVNQDPILGIIVINPTFDSVNEVKQANQSFDAEFGYVSGGVATYSTKSGSNSFHGDAFEYLFINTPGFQDFARNPFTENTAAGVPTTRRNQFGGSIGGRIIKDKLFFFGDAQLQRASIGGSLLTTVPTLENRGGNFGDWLALGSQYQIYDPGTGTGTGTIGVGRVPFAGNVIPTSRLSPQALNLLQYFPAANVNESGTPYNNYTANGNLTNNGNLWNTRWDYYPSQKDSVFGRYSYAQFDLAAPGVFGDIAGGQAFNNTNYAGSSTSLNQSIAAGWTHTANPTLINEFRFGYMRYYVNDVPIGYGTQPATAAGIPNANLDNTFTSGLPFFDIQEPGGLPETSIGYALGNNTHCNCPLTQREQQYQFVDNVNKTAGNHTLKFGLDLRYAMNLRVPSDNHRSGEFYFNNSTTGQIASASSSATGGLGIASFMLGDVENFKRYVSTSLNAQERQKRAFFYGQDEWRIRPNLTFTYGLRWELVFPETVNEVGNGAELNVNTGNMEVFGVGLQSAHGYQQMNYHNFAPRASLAYRPFKSTVVRAGYGWSYSLGTFGNNFGHNVTQNPPVLVAQNVTQQSACGNSFCTVFNLAQGPPNVDRSNITPNADGIFKWPGTDSSAFTRPGQLTMPVVYAYNFTVQQQFGQKISVSAGYVGNSGRHAILGTDENFDINQQLFVPGVANQATTHPFNGLYGPRYNYGWTNSILDFCNCANNQYNSLQAIFTIKNTAGYDLQGNYTYQVVKGDGYGGNEAYTFLYERALGYGNSSNMPHHQLVLVQNYEIPFGHGRKFGAQSNRFVDLALGGWNLSGITSFYSGLPFMPTIENYGTGVSVPYTGPTNRPNVGTGSPYATDQNRSQWITGLASGAYTLPAVNTFGNYPVNTLYGPILINQDVSLAKQFTITEGTRLQLRADATNFFNHTNLGLPNTDIQSANVGQITGTAQGGNYNMRRLQYSLSFTF
jgi:hypothetical protein